MTLSILLFFGIGLLAGFIASTPLGPINMVIANKVLSDNDWSMHWFVSGVVMVDTAVAVLALWGFQNWMIQLASNSIIVGIGAGFDVKVDRVDFRTTCEADTDVAESSRWYGHSRCITRHCRIKGDAIADSSSDIARSISKLHIHGLGTIRSKVIHTWRGGIGIPGSPYGGAIYSYGG